MTDRLRPVALVTIAFCALTSVAEAHIVSVDGVPFLPALTDPAATVESVQPQAAQMKGLFASLSREQLGMQSRLTSATMISDPARVEIVTPRTGFKTAFVASGFSRKCLARQ